MAPELAVARPGLPWAMLFNALGVDEPSYRPALVYRLQSAVRQSTLGIHVTPELAVARPGLPWAMLFNAFGVCEPSMARAGVPTSVGGPPNRARYSCGARTRWSSFWLTLGYVVQHP